MTWERRLFDDGAEPDEVYSPVPPRPRTRRAAVPLQPIATIAELPAEFRRLEGRFQVIALRAFKVALEGGASEEEATAAARAAVRERQRQEEDAVFHEKWLIELLGVEPSATLAEAEAVGMAFVNTVDPASRKKLAKALKLSEDTPVDLKSAVTARIRSAWQRPAALTVTRDPQLELQERVEVLAKEQKLSFTEALEHVKAADPELVRATANARDYRLGYDKPNRVGETDARAQLSEHAEAIARDRHVSFTEALEVAKQRHPQLVEQAAADRP